MNITFQGGQYFDPKLGWLSEKPKPQMTENTLPTLAIDDSMAYVIDVHLQKVLDNYKAYSAALKQDREPVGYIANDTTDDAQLITKNGFSYNGDTMTVNVDLQRSYYLSDSLGFYEEKRSEILTLKDTGYCDEAINMLLTELDNQFSSRACGGLSEQLQVLGYDEKTAEGVSLRFAKQYLSAREEGMSVEYNAKKALARMGLSNIDIDFGKRGHYGCTGYTGRVLIASSYDDVESYFKHIEIVENWSRKMENEEKGGQLIATKRDDGTIELNRRDGKSIDVLKPIDRGSATATE